MSKTTFEFICEIEPRLRLIKPIRVDRLTCNEDGFCSPFWNDYARVKAELQTLVGWHSKKKELSDDRCFSVCVQNFIEVASNKYHSLYNSGLFNDPITMEENEESIRLHNDFLIQARRIRLKNFPENGTTC